jgi:aspartate/tyrosine/aromatic aminotransferase
LPIDGYAPFVQSAQKLAFGAEAACVKEGRVCSSQVLSGTGGLRVGFEFLRFHYPSPVYVPNPTWGNHNAIIQATGLPLRTYPYWDPKTRGLNFTGMCKTLRAAPEGSIILLHPCAHNPTGVDPTTEQWKGILALVLEKKHIVFFDSAYQGFATGDFERDASTLRLFMNAGVTFVLTQSFAKNFGLYGERVGAIHFVCSTKEAAALALRYPIPNL